MPDGLRNIKKKSFVSFLVAAKRKIVYNDNDIKKEDS